MSSTILNVVNFVVAVIAVVAAVAAVTGDDNELPIFTIKAD